MKCGEWNEGYEIKDHSQCESESSWIAILLFCTRRSASARERVGGRDHLPVRHRNPGMTQWTTSPEVSRVIPSSRTALRPRASGGARRPVRRKAVTTSPQRSRPPFQLPGPIPFFSLGSFAHRNFAVGDPSLTSVQLDVVLEISVDGVPRPPLTFTFTFNHEETPNNLTPCPLIRHRPQTGARTV